MRFEPRQRVRLKGFDYSQPSAYFFTVCTHHHRHFLARAIHEGMQLTRYGNVVAKTWQELPQHYAHIQLDDFVVMPNHIHGLVILKPAEKSKKHLSGLLTIIGSLKSFSSRVINKLRGVNSPPIWQRSFYEHVLRPEEDINDYRQYILGNPRRWHLDKLNKERKL